MSRGSVVLVDDSPTLRNLVCQMVRHLGWDPHPFERAQDCYAEVLRSRPAMVLMDYEMDGVRGDEACKWLKAQKELAGTPVVMMTNGDDPGRLQKCHRADADDFLPKPIRMQQLHAKLKALEPGARPAPTRETRARRVLAIDVSSDRTTWRELEFAG